MRNAQFVMRNFFRVTHHALRIMFSLENVDEYNNKEQ